ncbi:hypothetical protein QBC47DRAFT_189485 [Echria macrotheca]|uniref:DUF7053 domain-containing protein n=1 Tax=Echria macrotheca TaxID=438768 RepID=A0AAJ0BCD7_9PEZI|nr:hypothetical protein QBC47DRAFT_189485 [Echria macrotheca]
MLRKKDTLTIITPIPGFIPRQLAIDILHSHSEVITLNPLVLEHKPIAAPQHAETDEYYSTWYEITERVTFVPGIGRMGASIIKFNGCFHDMPWGLQTHIYAPMNVDLRNTYRIAGNQPGFEPPEVPEIGLKALGAPTDGLYLREEIEIKCNVTVMSFVKAQLKKAGGEMVQRIIKKAELLDAGVLQAMIQDGKLKTVNPADRRNTIRSPIPSPLNLHNSPVLSNTTPPPQSQSPNQPYHIPRPGSTTLKQGYRPNTPGSAPPSAGINPPSGYGYGAPSGAVEMPAGEVHTPNQFAVEMPGDFYYQNNNMQPPKPAPQPHDNRDSATYRDSAYSTVPSVRASPNPSQSGQWSTAGSRPTSTSSTGTPGGGGYQSPSLDKTFSSQLSPHRETVEEHRDEALRKLDPRNDARIPHPSHYPPYNPADYAKVRPAQQAPYGHAQLTQRYQYR